MKPLMVYPQLLYIFMSNVFHLSLIIIKLSG